MKTERGLKMRYLPHTPEVIEEMLEVVGVKSLEDLFPTIPQDCRMTGELDLPELTEWELNDHMDELSQNMVHDKAHNVFLGAGSYSHHIPEHINYVLGRSELSTAYTPYQPEVSQGTLQAIFEFQTLVTQLLGMEVANASMYDGGSALAEALLMAIRIGRKKNRVAVSKLVHPSYRQVVRAYLEPGEHEIVELPYREDGTTDLSAIEGMEDLAAVAIQSPNFFGCIEDLPAAAEKVHAGKSLLVAAFSEALAFGLFKSPGMLGADIACGEGQSLGSPSSYGGPQLGLLATINKYVRNMPGRLIGETKDVNGKRGFVLTLATREQHIRRAKATSNICSNEGLCATRAAMYMASLGSTGFRDLARLNRDKAEYLKGELKKAGLNVTFPTPTFNEFVVELPGKFEKTYKKLLDKNIVAGLPLARFYPELDRHVLLCATETKSKEQMDALVKEVQS